MDAEVIIHANDQFLKLVQYDSLKDVIGLKSADFTHSDFKEIVQKHTSEQFSKPYEIILKRKDGTTFPCEVWGKNVVYHGKDLRITSLKDITERKQVERELNENEEKYRRLFEFMPLPIYLNVEGRFNDLNKAGLKLLGATSKDEVIGKPSLDFILPEFHEEVIDRQKSIFREFRDVVPLTEYKLKKLDGSIIDIESQTTRIPYDKENTAFTIAKDITKRKKAEEERFRVMKKLQDQEEKYRDLVETSQDLIWKCDGEGRFTYLNPAWEQVVGYKLEEMLGHIFSEFQLTEEVEKNIEEFSSHLKGASVKGYPSTYISKTGEKVYLIFNAIPLKNDKGEIIGTQGTAFDITDRVKIEKELIESEEKYKTLFNTAPIGIVAAKNDKIIYANPFYTKIFGYGSYKELLGKRIMDLAAPKDRIDTEIRKNRRLKGLEESSQHITFGIRKDETIFPINVTVKVINLMGEKVFLGFIEDVTDKMKAEEEKAIMKAQIQQNQKLESLGILAGGIAHDFNNILVGIMGNASLGTSEVDLNSPAYKLFQDIENSSNRAAELSNQMLAYSGKGIFKIDTYDFCDIIRDLKNFLIASTSKFIAINFDLCFEKCPVEADTTQISQVVINLVRNAVEAMHDQSGNINISIGVEEISQEQKLDYILGEDFKSDKGVFLEISDDGGGIEKEILDKIFDPFFSTKFTGRGLGLAVVLGIIRSHKGAIKASSTIGEGTTFKVIFPLSDKPIMHVEDQFKIEKDMKTKGSILVCDDEQVVRKVVEKMLLKQGFNVFLASDGFKGIQKLKENINKINLVLLDLTMPKMSGEVTFQLMQDLNPNIPIVIMSGYSEQETLNKFVNKNLAGFIQKPYSKGTLLSKINEVLNQTSKNNTGIIDHVD